MKGIYKGTVCKNNDPKGLGRVKIKCPSVYGNYESPWCEPCIPFTNPFGGELIIPKKGVKVWVMFIEGDRDNPVYIGTQNIIT